jgi:DNA-binding protein H-NS
MTTLADLIAQRDSLNTQIAQLQQQDRLVAIAQIRELMTQFGLTGDDVSGGSKKAPSPSAGKKVAPKYLDPVSGKTWTGRGVAPSWIAGKDRGAFLI